MRARHCGAGRNMHKVVVVGGGVISEDRIITPDIISLL